MSQGYVDTEILECSRLSSIDSRSGNNENNAIFTNQLGSGIQLSVGDTVSVQTAMISEIGAGSETIELKGKSLGVRQKFKYSKITDYTWTNYIPPLRVKNTQSQFIQNVEEEIELQDNEANLLISYYKTLNAENCFSLPRRFSHMGTLSTAASVNFLAVDSYLSGAPIHQIVNGQFIESDYYRDRNASSIYTSNPRTNRQLYKIRQDGSKYTVFAREKTFFDINNSSYPEKPAIPRDQNGSMDPALDVYNRYVEKKQVVIPAGRRSADFIAESITRQLQRGSDLKPINQSFTHGNPDGEFIIDNQQVMGSTYETDTFKLFTCTNASLFSETNYDTLKNASTGTIVTQPMLDWYSGFQYIAVKRPDFIEKGRATRVSGGFLANETIISNVSPSNSSTDRLTASIELSYPYTEENCSRFSQFFKIQEIYPEFWDVSKNSSSPYYQQKSEGNVPVGEVLITSDNSRMMHVDMIQVYDNGSQKRNTFGSDCMAPIVGLLGVPSAPLFFVYDKSTENIFYGNPEYTTSTTKLSYGAFTKGPNGNIQINTRGVGGIPLSYYSTLGFFVGQADPPDYSGLYGKRHIGYDYHFNAYGNAAVGLTNGLMATDPDATTLTEYRTINASGRLVKFPEYPDQYTNYSEMINKYYMGATNPTLTYDTSKDRFGWTNMYTPERQGNEGGAGYDDTTGQANPNSGTAVYKINKRLRRQSFAPGMGPYPEKVNASIYTAGGIKKIAFDLPNKSVYPYSVMDSHSGIFINSFGFDETNWKNGLFSILGFSYEQLQSPLTSLNVPQRRINTDNIDKLHLITTEADVIGKDVILYDQNVFGANMEHPVISPSVLLNFQQVVGHIYSNSTWTNPINIEAPSNIITASRVPLQMLRPFYSIRSNLIDDTSAYLGSEDSGINLPVMSVVSKSTTGGDFFIDSTGTVIFTITKPKVVTSITTAICDPDGSFARVDDRSSIIYKIQKNRNYPIDLLSTMFKKG